MREPPAVQPERIEPGIQGETALALWNERAASLVSHALILGLLASAAVTVVQFTQRLLPGWKGGYLVWLAVLIGLEAMTSSRGLRKISWFEADWLFLRTAEAVVILVSLRGLIYGLQGIERLRADLAQWGFDILNYFNNTEFIAVVIFSFTIWSLANSFARDLADQEGDRLIVDQDTLRFALQDRETARRRLMNRVFGLGLIMVILSAITRADLGILWADRPGYSGGGLNLLVYFMLGLVLFSLSQYATLRAFWTWDRIPIDPRLTLHWARYSLVFLLGLVFLVGLLPTRFSVGFFALMQRVMISLLNLLSAIVTAVLTFFLLVLFLLARAFGLTDRPFSAPDRVLPAITPTEAPPGAPLNSAFAWLDVLRTVIFWVIFLVVVFYSFDYFYRHYQERLGWIRRTRWIQTLQKFWVWLRHLFAGWKKSVRKKVLGGIEFLRSAVIPRTDQERRKFRIVNPLRRSPRQQVLFYYLAMVQRAAGAGRQRKPGQTPKEFAAHLGAEVPEAAEPVRELTDVFSTARYSDQPIDKTQAIQARSFWRRVQQIFRGRKD